MPFNPDGTFSLLFSFGTGTAPDNQFPPQVGDDLTDLATSLNLNSIAAASAFLTVYAQKATTLAGYGITDAEHLGLIATINTQTATYTVALSDIGGVVEMNSASANTVVIPPHTTVAFQTKSYFTFVQLGAGQTVLSAGGGVTIHSAGGNLKLNKQYSTATMYQRAQDEWVVSGDLVA